MIYNKLGREVVFLITALLFLGGNYYLFPFPGPFTSTSVAFGEEKGAISYRAIIEKVIDGDTFDAIIHVPIPWGKEEMFLMMRERVRICCIDAPESARVYAQCEEEAQLGQKAKAFLVETLSPMTKVLLSEVGHDKYGRILAKVTLLNGQDIGELMIGKGLAQPYQGKTKPSWCKK